MQRKSPQVGLFGYGSFGKLLATHASRYADVLIYHPHARGERLPKGCRHASLSQAAAADVIILAVNLPRLESSLKQIRPFLKKDALVADVTSVKVKPVQLMKKLLPKHVQILATHPVFGPQSASSQPGGLKGHTIVIHPVRLKNVVEIEKFLKQQLGLRVLRLTPAEHDSQMALVHGLTFFLARGLMGLGLPTNGLQTPSYQKLLSLAELETHHSQELFATIEDGNPYAGKVRAKFIRQLQKLDKQSIKGK